MKKIIVAASSILFLAACHSNFDTQTGQRSTYEMANAEGQEQLSKDSAMQAAASDSAAAPAQELTTDTSKLLK